MDGTDLIARAFAAFRDDVASPPPLTLRGGNAVDGYERAEPYDPAIDAPGDVYFETFAFWGLGYLDARSWRHYLPRLIEYALRRPEDPAMVVEALVRSLRPPDRYPPRLGSLSAGQEGVVREFLEWLALGDLTTDLQLDARQALEEWWLPDPRSRPGPEAIAAMRAEPVTYKEVGGGGYRLTVPITFSGSGVRDIPEESRRVETWGGYLCGDADTVVAINVKPLAFRSFRDTVQHAERLFLDEGKHARELSVSGARRGFRIDGLTEGDSPTEPRHLTLVVAAIRADILTLTIRTWPRDDVQRAVDRIVASFRLIEPAESPHSQGGSVGYS